jgi:hypothetical protein
MLTGLMGRRSDLVVGDECAWDHVEAAPATPSTAGGGGVPAPQSDAPVVEPRAESAAPASEPEPEDDPFEPVVATADQGDEDDRDPILAHPRVKALRKENRKLLRRFQKLQPLAARVKDRNLDEVFYQAESFQRLARAAESNPRLAALLSGQPDVADGPPRPTSSPQSFSIDDLDPDKVPFNTDDAVGRFLLDQFRRYGETIQTLQQRIDEAFGKASSVESVLTNQAERAARTNWKTKVEAAADELPSGVRRMFMDAVHGAYQEARSRRLNLTPEKVIAHYLNDFKTDKTISAAQATRATAAAAQRMADANKHLPRQVAGGVPSSVRPRGETVQDVNRRMRRFGA